MAGFRFKYATPRAAIPFQVSSTSPTVTTTQVGYLFVTASTIASKAGWCGQTPVTSTAHMGGMVIGIIADVAANTTAGSTVPIHVIPILAGDIIEANYSTNVERSTGATSVITTTNLGKYIGIGSTIGASGVALGYYLDPSLVSTACGTSDDLFFKMLGFSTQDDSVYGMFSSTCIVW
jgi:hypothetical protein